MVTEPVGGGAGRRVAVLGFPVDPLPLEVAVGRLSSALSSAHERLRVVTLNPEMLMAGLADPALRAALYGADLVVPDGIGIVWALRRQGVRQPGRVTGVDLVETLFAQEHPRALRVFLLGGQPGVGAEAAARIRQRWPGVQVVGFAHGYFAPEENEGLIAMINEAGADLLLVGMGVPRQEIWLEQHWPNLVVRLGIGVGGLLDLWAGRTRRAPALIRSIGLEWAYRACREPVRWRRLRVLPSFIRMVRAEGRDKMKEKARRRPDVTVEGQWQTPKERDH